MAYLGRLPGSSDAVTSTDSDLAVRITKEVHDRDAGDSDLTFAILDAGTGIDSDF